MVGCAEGERGEMGAQALERERERERESGPSNPPTRPVTSGDSGDKY
jgi:hypothetical protein